MLKSPDRWKNNVQNVVNAIKESGTPSPNGVEPQLTYDSYVLSLWKQFHFMHIGVWWKKLRATQTQWYISVYLKHGEWSLDQMSIMCVMERRLHRFVNELCCHIDISMLSHWYLLHCMTSDRVLPLKVITDGPWGIYGHGAGHKHTLWHINNCIAKTCSGYEWATHHGQCVAQFRMSRSRGWHMSQRGGVRHNFGRMEV